MKNNLLLLLLIPFIFSCKSKPKEEFSVDGQFANVSGQKILLSELQVKQILPLDSTTLDPQGIFHFVNPLRMRSFFILSLGNKRVILVPDFGEKIRVKGDADKTGETWVVSGSKDSEYLQDFFRRSAGNIAKADSLKELLHQHENMEDMLSISRSVDSTFAILMDDQRKISMKSIDEHPGSLVNLIILNFPLGSAPVLDPQQDYSYFHKTDSLLLIQYPDNPHVVLHHSRLDAVKNLLKIKNDLQQPQKKQKPGIIP